MGQLLPHPELGPPLHPHLTSKQRIAAWIDLMEFGDELFLAGLSLRSKRDQDPLAAQRESYARHMEEQDEKLLRMARRFGEPHGR
ncbi:MAG: hypothetical protein O3C40_05700 [Planctomycetota bacterium]|nr:hypothetical protein [Planctomycetota bacterium]